MSAKANLYLNPLESYFHFSDYPIKRLDFEHDPYFSAKTDLELRRPVFEVISYLFTILLRQKNMTVLGVSQSSCKNRVKKGQTMLQLCHN